MNNSGSGNALERFFAGKGFYIVLFLCLAVIGISFWMLASGNETMQSDSSVITPRYEDRRVETIIVTPQETPAVEITEEAPELIEEGLTEVSEPVPEPTEAVVAVMAPSYTWPVSGEIERGYSSETLSYDNTMRDWRVHQALDILAPIGQPVVAAHAGVVECVMQDDLLGTVVIIDHGDGSRGIYANLAAEPTVITGDVVACGAVIGAVGDTAIGESGQQTHLHFAMTANGQSVDPLGYLPG